MVGGGGVLFSESSINQPVKAIAQFFSQAVGQPDQDFLEAFVLQEGIEDRIAGEGLALHFPREKGPDEE